MYKDREWEQARSLRAEGYSIAAIAEFTSVAKSTVSVWVRDIPLSEDQLASLESNRSRGREKAREARISNRRKLMEEYQREAEQEYATLSKIPLFMFGLALYIGEGKKYGDNEIVLTNWDHRVLRKALEFYRLLGIQPERIHCRVTLHPGRDVRRAQHFWSEALRLPLDQFSKPYQGISPTSRGKRGEKWPYGGCTLSAYSIKLKQKLNRWMDLALEDC
jgi:hypothetical protein